MDVPSYEGTFGALLATILAVMLPEEYTISIITYLANLALNSTRADFLVNHYLPEILEAVQDIVISPY